MKVDLLMQRNMFAGTVLLRVFAYGSALSTYILILIGGYVVFSGAGAACGSSGPDSWPLCNGQFVPPLADRLAVVEWTHRLFTLVVGLFVLGTTILAWTRFRNARRVLELSTASFLVLLGQIILGLVTVKTDLDPGVSTAHLAVASALFALVVLNAATVRTYSSASRDLGPVLTQVRSL